MSLIDARDLGRAFTTRSGEVTALTSASMSVGPGDSVAVVGRSGSGKSTFLHLLGLMDRPTNGTYSLLGEDVDGLSRRDRDRLRSTALGFVFQAFHLIEHRTVMDNVALPLAYHRVPPKRRRVRATEVLESVGLGHRIDASPSTLSGGERQRVAIARAIVHQPSVLLCDEPTGNLDSENAHQIIDLLLRTATDGIAVVVVTHDTAVADRMGRTYRMSDGRLAEQVAP